MTAPGTPTLRWLSPETPAEAWHAPQGDDDLPCIWSVGSGRLADVLTRVAKLPESERQDIYVTINGNTDITGPEWPYLPLATVRLLEA